MGQRRQVTGVLGGKGARVPIDITEHGVTQVRKMCKTKFWIAVFAAAVVLWAQFSFAQGWGYGVQQPGPGHRGAYGAPQGRPARDAGAASQQFQPAGRPHGSQLTEEQRRQLHRDLDKANREIYGAPRGR